MSQGKAAELDQAEIVNTSDRCREIRKFAERGGPPRDHVVLQRERWEMATDRGDQL